jgi:YHS domain-containing protein
MERKILKAGEEKILTDGITYGSEIYLAEGENAQKFKEIPYEEYIRLTEEEEIINE